MGSAGNLMGVIASVLMLVIGLITGQSPAGGPTGLPTGGLPPTAAGPLTGNTTTSFAPGPLPPPAAPPSPGKGSTGQIQTGGPVDSPSGPFIFPIAGACHFTNDYGIGTHSFGGSSVYNVGNDLFADRGTPIVSPVPGRIHTVGTNAKGGNRCHLMAADGTDYYFCHMDEIASGITEGLQVEAGTQLGIVGDTGNAKGTDTHLHFAAVKDGEPWNPYNVLKAAQAAATPQS